MSDKEEILDEHEYDRQQGLAVFRTFPNVEQAREFGQLLSDNGLSVKLVENSPAVDITFSGNTMQTEFQILVDQNEFDKAEGILQDNARDLVKNVDREHYLFQFTNEELYDILLKPDEWNEFDYILAQHILDERGKPVDEEMLRSLRKQRIDDLTKPEEGHSVWIYAGYISAFLGGLLGLAIGAHITTSKKTLPDGQVLHRFSEKDRKHGKRILVIGLIMFPAAIIIRVISEI